MRFIILFSFLFTFVYAQNSFSVKGQIKDAASQQSVEYCTISVLNSSDKTLVTGGLSDLKGSFEINGLKPGTYLLEISFIGFKSVETASFTLDKDHPAKDFGVLYLNADAKQLNEVEVTAIKSSVRYELDKKVVDVDKNIAASNGTASDVLATVPSVQTDINGNVILRGSSNFKVFINGRPSVLDANDALQQIPAATIQNIEIITNPSARYDAEGNTGIINIITKKNSDDGFMGVINARAGIFNVYGGDATLSYKKKKFTYTVSGNYNHRGRPGTYYSEINTTNNDTTVSTINDGTKKGYHSSYNTMASIEYRPKDNQYVNLAYSYGGFSMGNDDDMDYLFWNKTSNDSTLFNNINKTRRNGPFHEIAGNYGYTFKNKAQLTAHASFNKRKFNEYVDNTRNDNLGDIIYATKSQESGPSSRFRMNIDYSLPIGENHKFEFGMMQQISKSKDENIAYLLDVSSQEFVEQEQFYANYNNSMNNRAFYGIFSSKWDKFSYQIGMRSEKTERTIKVNNTGQEFKLNRLDLFPSLHAAYNASEQHQLFVSYSKRIDRPRFWYLEPNSIYTDANTLFRGNPALQPEFIHAFDLGWLFKFKKKGSWNNEVYYRIEKNNVQVIRVPLSYSLTEQFPINLGSSNSIGWESTLSLVPFKWWNTDLMANLFYFKTIGSYGTQSFDRSSFSYSLRCNNYFTIKKNTKFQFNVSYSSPVVNPQGRTAYTLRFDGGFKQDLLNRKLTIGLQVSDLFNTYINKSWIESNNFSQYRINNPYGPSVVASISYKINNYKPSKQNYSDDDGGGF